MPLTDYLDRDVVIGQRARNTERTHRIHLRREITVAATSQIMAEAFRARVIHALASPALFDSAALAV